MAFTNNFRIERIYFEKLKSNIDILKSYIEAGATGEALELLKNSVDVDGAVLLLYRNLGEAWAELADLIQKTQKDLKDLAEKTEAYHDELNERIDDVNNYLMMLIRELEARLQVVEQDLATMNRNKYYDLVENNGSYLIEKDGETVYFDDIKEDVDFPHNVILRYDSGTGTVELEVREFTDSRIDFYSIGLAGSDKTVKEILVSIADTEAVTYSENTLENPLYTFGTGLSLDSDNELSVDFDTVQAKLSEGFGIDIDSNNEIKVDTTQVQEKLIAGQNITLTPDSTDPTKTVIDASGGASISDGFGVELDSGYLYNISDINEYKTSLPTSKQEFTKPTINVNYELNSANYYVGESAHQNFGFTPSTYNRVIRQIKATFTGTGILDTYTRATKDYLMLLCELRIAFNDNSTTSPHLPDIERDFVFNFTVIMGVDQNNIYCVERGRSQTAIEKYDIHNLTGIVNNNIVNNVSSRFDRGDYIFKAVKITGTLTSTEMAEICRKIYAKMEIDHALYSE